jgi:tetratricopeptide (TPR) repeat protein
MLAGCPSASHALDFSTNVTTQGGVAAGRDIRDSTIIVGIPPEKLEALVRDRTALLDDKTKLLEGQVKSHELTIDLLKKELNINERQIGAALNILGENDVPPERLAAKLVEIAKRFKELKEAGAPQPGDAPEVAQLRKEANQAIDVGDLARADELLAGLEQVQQAALRREQQVLDQRALDLAETQARRGDVALTGLHYLDAARHFAAAAAQVPRDERRLAYLDEEADALYRQGDERGDNAALDRAIERYRSLLALRSGERASSEWAATLVKFGNALVIRGEREGRTDGLEQAVTTYREVLKERTRASAALDWAVTQNNLGTALRMLGERESGIDRLEQAVTAHREALKELTRERVPFTWV